MVDIGEELGAKVLSEFWERYANGNEPINRRMQQLMEAVERGVATYTEANEYAALTGELLAQTLQDIVTPEVLPNGRFYYNIAQKTLPKPLRADYDIVSEFTASVQTAMNEKAGIGIAAQIPAFDESRAAGLIELVSNAERYAGIEPMFLQSIINFSQYYADASARENAAFQYEAGLNPKIVRKLESSMVRYYKPRGGKKTYSYKIPCEWCRNLAGEYDYPVEDSDVYRRHRDCRCTVEFVPGDGRVQNAHTKKWRPAETPDEMIAKATAQLEAAQ